MNFAKTAPYFSGITTPWGFCIASGTAISGTGAKAFFWYGWLLGGIILLSQFLMIQLVQAFLPFIPASGMHNVFIFKPLVFVNPLLFPLYSLMVRFSPAAGYHAAEHMAINALYSGQPLTRTLVANQSRVDENCGTANVLSILGLGLLLYLGCLLWLWTGPWLTLLMMGLSLLLLYRYFTPLNFWFQEHVYTVPPNPNQLECAFQSVCDLAARMDNNPLSQHPSYWPRSLKRTCWMGIGLITCLSLASYWHWISLA